MEAKKSKKKIIIISAIAAIAAVSAIFIIPDINKPDVNKKEDIKKYDYITEYIEDNYDIEAKISDVSISTVKINDKKKKKYTFKLEEECYGNLRAVFIQDNELDSDNLNLTDFVYRDKDGKDHSLPKKAIKEEIEYDYDNDCDEKPVIYLYPEEETDINVRLFLDDNTRLTCTYPEYNEETGWNVTAQPDSVLTDEDENEYSYLFWEAASSKEWDETYGFVIKGEDTAEFLRDKLSYLGLIPKEYNEFIVYWLPRMKDNNYNLITFRTDEYTDMARLEVTPEPESVQRVFMTFKALDEYQKIEEQVLEPFERHGYTLIEWGGLEIK